MKNIYLFAIVASLGMAIIADLSQAQESCKVQVKSQDVNTPVPKDLEGATIVVRTKDGVTHTMKAEEFKVVKRKQQFKITERVTGQDCEVAVAKAKDEGVDAGYKTRKDQEKKNMIIGGLGYDYTSLSNDLSTDGTTSVIKLYSNKGPVGDIGYMRRRLYDTNWAAGLSINTNVAPRGFLGYEF